MHLILSIASFKSWTKTQMSSNALLLNYQPTLRITLDLQPSMVIQIGAKCQRARCKGPWASKTWVHTFLCELLFSSFTATKLVGAWQLAISFTWLRPTQSAFGSYKLLHNHRSSHPIIKSTDSQWLAPLMWITNRSFLVSSGALGPKDRSKSLQ